MQLSIFPSNSVNQAVWFAFLILLLGVPLHSSDISATATASSTMTSAEAELIALDRAWIDAEVHHDKAALERLLDERFLVTSASGSTVDRTAFIERIMTKTISPFEVIHDVIIVHDGTALIIDLTSDRATKFTWIAIKKNGNWRVVSETMTKVAPAK